MSIQAIDGSIVYGYLGNDEGEDMNSVAGRRNSGIHYGWPAGGTSEPDVSAQWIFDEASGDIVDEVGGVTLSVAGAPTFSVAVGGLWLALSPGITYAASGQTHKKASATSECAPGTGDYTWEWWGKYTAGSGTRRMITTYDASTGGMALWASGPDANFYFYLLYDDLSTSSWNPAFTVNIIDGSPHKLRFKVDRDAANGGELFCDGISAGTKSFSDAAKTISAPQMSVGSDGAVANMTIYEARFSKNATNNSGPVGAG